jgi:hypothetical protein
MTQCLASSCEGILSSEEVDKDLDEILGDSETGLFDSDLILVGSMILPVGEAMLWKEQKMGAPSAVSFIWEDMSNYIGRRERFIRNCGLHNEAKNGTEDADIFKNFFIHELVEIIVRESNIYAQRCIMSRGLTMSFRCGTGNPSR